MTTSVQDQITALAEQLDADDLGELIGDLQDLQTEKEEAEADDDDDEEESDI